MCDQVLSNGASVRQLCPKSCNCCPGGNKNYLTCDNLVRNCNSGQCVPVGYFGVQSVQCYCPSNKGGAYCQQNNACQYNPCLNGGYCTPLYETASKYKCQCPIGYTGSNCEIATPRCNINCYNGGTCQIGANNLPCCTCASYYTGAFCQNYVGACYSNPCLNGGTCQPTYNGFVCNCQRNFVFSIYIGTVLP